MKKLILIIALLFPLMVTRAQETEQEAEQARTARMQGEIYDSQHKLRQSFQKSSYTPFGGGSISNLVSNISLSSTLNNGQNGKAELKYTKNWWTGGISVDQKIGKNDNEATPFDLDGLSPGTTVEFNLQKMFWNPVLTSRSFDAFQNAKRDYVEYMEGRERKNHVDPRTITLQRIVDSGTDEQREMLRHITLKQPVFVNIKYAFTKTEFAYTTDSVTLSKTTKDYLTPSFSLVVGLPIRRNGSVNSMVALTYNYSMSYKKADDLTFSVPFGSTNNYTSQTIAFGAPKQKTDNKINVEWRTNLGIKTTDEKTFSLGVAPSTTFGIDSKKVAFYLPVYFINGVTNEGKPKGLQGGVKFGYVTSMEAGKVSSFKEGFSTQLVISAPFDVFGSLNSD